MRARNRILRARHFRPFAVVAHRFPLFHGRDPANASGAPVDGIMHDYFSDYLSINPAIRDSVLMVRRPFENGEVRFSFYDTGRRQEYVFQTSPEPAP